MSISPPRPRKRVAEMMYRKARPDGAGFDRFICFSLWRCLTPGPQDMPLALCEGGSVRDDEGTANTKVDVDVIPTGDDLFVRDPGRRGYGRRHDLPPLAQS